MIKIDTFHVSIFIIHIFVYLLVFLYAIEYTWRVKMEKLKIVNKKKTTDSITRTIRISGSSYDKISIIAEENNISFNNVVNQIIEFGLDSIRDDAS